MENIKFDLNDIALIPDVVSNIGSRSECDVYNKDGMLPLMAAPMDTVVDKNNVHHYLRNHITVCLPRGEKMSDIFIEPVGKIFYSYSLKEVEDYLNRGVGRTYTDFYKHSHILIDIANGHMKKLVNVVEKFKKEFPNKILMVGNVANPLTYKNLAMVGADYVRCSIGTGAGCTTAANVAINYPMGSLISECYAEKIKGDFDCKIVADGGMRGYDDIIKALALGADYVMLGSVFNKTMQSSGFNYLWGIKLPYDLARKLWKWGLPVKKKYRGMSTKAVQRKWGKAKLVTAEGITKYQKIKYNLCSWTENFEDYLRSSMSYCGSKTLNEFIGNTEWVFITENALKRYQK